MITHYRIKDMEENIKTVVTIIEELINIRLSCMGFFYRLFSRIKTKESIKKKFEKKNDTKEYKMQDFIGFRLVLYFADDIPIIEGALLKDFSLDNKSVDKQKENEFSIRRCNYVYKIPKGLLKAFKNSINDLLIDTTFELQIRTLNSESWQEIDHDFKYKPSKNFFKGAIARKYNSLIATYELVEYATISIFDEICERIRMEKDVKYLIFYKFRIRIKNFEKYIYRNNNNIKKDELINMIYSSNRKIILLNLLEKHSEHNITTEDIINEILIINKKEPLYETERYSEDEMKNVIFDLRKKINNLNLDLGTLNDERYLEFKQFMDEINSSVIE
jgi:ppGpp synthetase/RelA/SpoT-type nucleotidyltranferase